MRKFSAGALGALVFLLGGTSQFEPTPPPPEAFVEPANPRDRSEIGAAIVAPACRIIGNYPQDPFDSCKQKGGEMLAAGVRLREVYVKMCGEIFGFKSTFAYAAYYCFSKAANASQDKGLQAIVESCETLYPAAMEARWMCIEHQTTEVLRQTSGAD